MRLALYHRQPGALQSLLAAHPPLDGLDLAALGWADDLKRALAEDPDLVERHAPDGFTALHYACFFGGARAVGVLLDAGASPNEPAGNEARLRPLHSAAAARDAAAVRLLLEAGADPDAQQAGGFTALHAAAQHDDAETAALLLQLGASPGGSARTAAPTRWASPARPRRPRCSRSSAPDHASTPRSTNPATAASTTRQAAPTAAVVVRPLVNASAAVPVSARPGGGCGAPSRPER